MSDSSETSPSAGPSERHEYKAEVARILQLMVHSVYTDREIFLRELISNASDACDKLRYRALTEPELLEDDPEPAIAIVADSEAGTVTIRDNGIGMDRDELVQNLGTIAHSGTGEFLEQLKSAQADTSSLIGQFGVGFYSAFMVADRVVVTSRKAGTDAGHIWESDGASGFTVTPAEDEVPRGTAITIHLNAQSREFLDEAAIERVVKTYSDSIVFPVRLGDRQLNSASALWARQKSEVSEDEYRAFYRHISGHLDAPQLTVHYLAEGRNEYAVLLFIPEMRPFDLYQASRHGHVKLFVKRVFITDDAEILPAYLRFVCGVIDSQDMPLNISREMLQNNPTVAAIRKAVTNRVVTELKKLQKNDEDYVSFWETFGAVLKEGLYEDPERRDDLLELCRFRSTRGEGWRTLGEYVADMKENQTAIYYATGESLAQLRASPQLEGFRARDVEVLLLDDPVDSFWVTGALGYEGKPFQSITQGDADLSAIPGAEDKAESEDAGPSEDEVSGLLESIRTALGEAVSDVKTSRRLVESPACLIAPAMGPDRTLDKILSRHDQASGLAPVLEINADHALVSAMRARLAVGDQQEFDDLAWLMLDQARILEGDLPSDPARFADRLNRLVTKGLAT